MPRGDQSTAPPVDFAARHRRDVRRSDGTIVNLAESPLARLAAGSRDDPAFLAPHQVDAGERIRTLAARAQLQPRTTMNYSPATTARGPAGLAEIGDMAADARRMLAGVVRALPPDCADVVLDVCAFEKGLQLIEVERGWPRRSAKLVLRIGLEQAARHFGLTAQATGADSRRPHRWLGDNARPNRFE
jgi:hypothetical protein